MRTTSGNVRNCHNAIHGHIGGNRLFKGISGAKYEAGSNPAGGTVTFLPASGRCAPTVWFESDSRGRTTITSQATSGCAIHSGRAIRDESAFRAVSDPDVEPPPRIGAHQLPSVPGTHGVLGNEHHAGL